MDRGRRDRPNWSHRALPARAHRRSSGTDRQSAASEIRGLGFAGGYTVLKGFLRQVRPRPAAGFEDRFETPAGRQAQVDFAHFRTDFPTSREPSGSSGCSRSCSATAE